MEVRSCSVAATSIAVLIANVMFTTWVAAASALFKGSCTQTSKYSIAAHLIVNVLATLAFGAIIAWKEKSISMVGFGNELGSSSRVVSSRCLSSPWVLLISRSLPLLRRASTWFSLSMMHSLAPLPVSYQAISVSGVQQPFPDPHFALFKPNLPTW